MADVAMKAPMIALRRAAPWLSQLTAILGLLGWVLLWWLAVAAFDVSADFVPTPVAVAEKLGWMIGNRVGEGSLDVHALASFWRFLAGFAAAIAIGIPLGGLMGHFRAVDWAVNPIFEMIRYVPPIAWAPFAILWLGASFGAQAFVIFISTLPPVLINAYRAVRQVDPGLVNAARTLGAGHHTILLEVVLPSSVPIIVAGLRIGVATGWMALVAAEIVAGSGSHAGLGFLILVGQQTLQADLTIAAMLMIGLVGAAFDLLLRRVERHVVRWR